MMSKENQDLFACYEVGSAQVPGLLSKLYRNAEFLSTDIGKLVVTNFISDEEVQEKFDEADLQGYVAEVRKYNPPFIFDL